MTSTSPTTGSDEPLDLGEIEPGEKQAWHPGDAWQGHLSRTPPERAQDLLTFTPTEVERAAAQCTWANRREGIDDTLVDWPSEDYEAYAIIAKALELLGIRIVDG